MNEEDERILQELELSLTQNLGESFSPEQLLIIAIIDQAVRDACGSANNRRISATRWLRSISRKPYSFRWCCEALGIYSHNFQGVIANGNIRKERYTKNRKKLI